MLKIKELKKMLKEMVLFFVLQLLAMVLFTNTNIYILIINILTLNSSEFQFSVLGSGFSVLAPILGKFNSLYPEKVL